jgi:hypothetical protein
MKLGRCPGTEQVDNLGASYSIPSETVLLIPSVYTVN